MLLLIHFGKKDLVLFGKLKILEPELVKSQSHESSLNFDFQIIFSVGCGQDKPVHYTDVLNWFSKLHQLVHSMYP
ncbi:hypothetical protein BpHYR1_037243 [Brachionus plicatilis]|uniref:Uncharacterized protein n=1 Tax=Brachionus plicatilis TaxID=10195 RepID=A0A3M7T4Z0_BRAPC|nr:hypothetical protein BpHYR1_037243 [Brachionus plicatilis]